MRKLLLLLLFLPITLSAQTVEIMPGLNNVFIDVQFFKPFKPGDYSWTLFFRARGEVDYEKNTDIFSGLYLSYTTKPGFGATLLGRISGGMPAMDFGPHYTKTTKTFMVFATISSEVKKNPAFSWFSIVRFMPPITDKLNLFSSLELFFLVNKTGHLLSVQRMRLGLKQNKWQYGLGLNLAERGEDLELSSNLGVFLRREF